MKKLTTILCTMVLVFGMVGMVEATTLDFNDSGNLGVTLGGNMSWNDTGGGHLFVDGYYDDDFIFFSGDTFVNGFEMNAMPWEGHGGGDIGMVDIAAYNSSLSRGMEYYS